MKRDMTISSTTLAFLLVSAVRYALGRRTYIVEQTCNAVMLYRDALTENDRAVIVRDIRSAASLGDGCDARDWTALLSQLEIDAKREAAVPTGGDAP